MERSYRVAYLFSLNLSTPWNDAATLIKYDRRGNVKCRQKLWEEHDKGSLKFFFKNMTLPPVSILIKNTSVLQFKKTYRPLVLSWTYSEKIRTLGSLL